MPIVVVPGSAHANEILKWEYDHYFIGEERGKRGPRVYVEFPKMLYKAGRNDHNKIDLLSTILADNADHQRTLEASGWVDGPGNAIARAERDEREVARLAANRAFNDKKMSPEAQAEAARYEDETPGHVAEVPAQPVTRRGRPKKEVSLA